MESSRHWDICLRFGRAGIKNGGDCMPFKIVRNDITKMNTEAIMGVRSILKLRTFYIGEKRHMNYNPIWDYNEEAFYEIRYIKIIK